MNGSPKDPARSDRRPSNPAAAIDERVTFDLVLRELRGNHFAVLSTVGEDGTPHSAGVNYGIAERGRDFAVYVMTRRHLQKSRNITHNPKVSLVVPIARRLLWLLPPATVQLQGRAEILDWTDIVGTDVFEHFWMGQRLLAAYRASNRRGETRICFLKITPDSVIRTYMVGYSIWELRTRMESGTARVVIPRSDQFAAP